MNRDLETEARNYVVLMLRGGFVSEKEIVPSVCEILENDFDRGDVERVAAHCLAQESDRLRTEQQTWPLETDCDRLDSAFRELESKGVVARQDFLVVALVVSARFPT